MQTNRTTTTPAPQCTGRELQPGEWPEQFAEAAAKFLMTPARLAYLLLADFAEHPPKELIVIQTPARQKGGTH